MIERAAMLAVPPVAIGLAALVFLGPGATRPALGARAFGVPAGDRVALRVLTATSLYGVEEMLAVPDLRVFRRHAGRDDLVWEGASGPDGVAEVRFDVEPGAPAGVELIVIGRDRLLAHGLVDRTSHPVRFLPKVWIEGPARGDLAVRVLAQRGYYAAPFPGLATVEVARADGAPVVGARVKLDAPGADVRFVAGEVTDDRGHLEVELTPHAHTIEVSVDASRDVDTGHWEGHLPVVPGAMIVVKEGAVTKVLAPSRRERAYVSHWTDRGRVGGQVVTLVERPDGISEGALSPELERILGAAHTDAQPSVAGDPMELGVGTVAAARVGTFAPPKLEQLLDGLPQAIAAESARSFRVRRWGVAVLVAAALSEILFLLAGSRRSQAKLEAHLAAHGDGAGAAARTPAKLWALASAAIVAFAFAIVAVLAAFR